MERERVWASLLVEKPLLVYFSGNGEGRARSFASPQTLKEELEARRENGEEFCLAPLLQGLLGYKDYFLEPIWTKRPEGGLLREKPPLL